LQGAVAYYGGLPRSLLLLLLMSVADSVKWIWPLLHQPFTRSFVASLALSCPRDNFFSTSLQPMQADPSITSCAGGHHAMPPLTFWRWKLCPSHVWGGIPLCQF